MGRKKNMLLKSSLEKLRFVLGKRVKDVDMHLYHISIIFIKKV